MSPFLILEIVSASRVAYIKCAEMGGAQSHRFYLADMISHADMISQRFFVCVLPAFRSEVIRGYSAWRKIEAGHLVYSLLQIRVDFVHHPGDIGRRLHPCIEQVKQTNIIFKTGPGTKGLRVNFGLPVFNCPSEYS
jgi:hypothetical protein